MILALNYIELLSLIISIGAGLVLPTFVIVGKYKFFEKTGQKGWHSLIPFYGRYIYTTKICGLGASWFYSTLCSLIFVPAALLITLFVNQMAGYNLAIKLDKDKTTLMILGGIIPDLVMAFYGYSIEPKEYNAKKDTNAFI